MAVPAPLNSFLGGISLPVSVHALMLLNGNVLGISGFIHRAIRGSSEALVAAVGFIAGGAAVGLIEGSGPQLRGLSLLRLATSGFLVGLGTKLSNGCTSGHMVCGVARFSMRSIVATAAFFATGVITAYIAHGNLGPTASLDGSFGSTARKLLVAQIVPLAVSVLIYLFAPSGSSRQLTRPEAISETLLKESSVESPPRHVLRHLAFLSTSAQFALGLQLSGLTNPDRAIRFLLLPFHRAFDPSLAFLAAGTMPLAMLLFHCARGKELPRLGGEWAIIPKGAEMDWRLVTGAMIFGVGWGLGGICPGPGLVNFGRALVHNEGQLSPAALWLAAMATGGLLA